MKLRWVGDEIGSSTGYSNNVSEVLLALSKFIDAKAIGITNNERYKNIVIPYDDIDSETHTVCRVFNEPLVNSVLSRAKSVNGMLVLEGDRLYERWITTANILTQLWATSEFNRQQFINNGIVRDKIRVIHHGVDPDVYNSKVQPLEIPDLKDFVFLFVGGYAIKGDRKGADLLVRAFKEEFNEKENASLILKINTAYNPSFDSKKDLLEISGHHRNIKVLISDMNQTQLASLYALSNVHVCPTAGEGFGMTLSESMACGKPVIATNYSGHLDFCKPEFSYLINVDRFEPAHYGQYDIMSGTSWARPSISHLKELMRYTFDNQSEVKMKGLKASKYILKNFTWERAALRTIKCLKEI